MNFPDGDALPAFLLDLAFKSLAVTLMAIAITRLFLPPRRTGAFARHLLWLCTLGGLLVLPFASLVMPVVHPPAMPTLPTLTKTPFIKTPSLPSRLNPQQDNPASPEANGFSSVIGPNGAKAGNPQLLPQSSEPNFTVGKVLGVLWLAGTALLICRLLVFLAVVRKRSQRDYAALALNTASAGVVLRAQERIGVTRAVCVRTARGATTLPPVPMTFGILHPTILLPASAAEWPTDLLHAVLSHEMAHIRRGDWVSQLCAEVATAFYWWNPLVWHAARNLRAESEECCDDLVIASGMPPSEYAAHLVHVVETLRKTPRYARILTAVSMVEKPEISRRVEAVLRENKRRSTLSRKAIAAGVLVACTLFLSLAALRQASRAETAETAEYGVTFPGAGGGAVKVDTISYDSVSRPVWAPDGTLLSEAEASVPETIRKGGRVLKITLSGISESDHAVFSAKDDPAYVRGIGNVVGGAYKTSSKSRVYTVGTAPVKAKTTTSLDVKLASGPWNTLHQWLPGMVSPANAVQLTASTGGYPAPFESIRLRYKKPKQVGGDTLLPLMNNGPMLVDWRVTAVLRSGASVSSRDSNASRKGDEGESQSAVVSGKVLFPGVRLSDIVRFEFQVRPYRFVTLKNIALYPDRAAEVTTRANDKVMLPNKAVVELVGVANAETRTGEKQLWWTLQGKPLAFRPIPPDRSHSYFRDNEVHPDQKRIDAAIRVTRTTDDKRVTIASVSPESRLISLRSGGNMGTGFHTATADVAKGEGMFSLRVGVSSGKWNRGTDWGISQYVGLPVPRGATGTRTFSNHQGEGSVVYREPTQEGKDVNLIVSHNLQNADWRIVTELKDGRTIVGKDESAASSSVIMGDLLFPNVKIESIALFKFQTRDYQYATFKNIALNPVESSASASP